jgi:phage terminase small subunit
MPDKKPSIRGLSPKQKAFCRSYVIDWNGARAYRVAYPKIKEENARIRASFLLTNVNIQAYCELIQRDLEKLCGISKAKVLNEHLKLAYSSIAHLHNTWIERKELEELTEDQKSCISEISTQTRTQRINNEPIEVEFIKIKLYDKQKALDSISKMMGYEAPNKTELTGKDGKPLITSIQIEIINNASQVKKDDSGR